MKKTIKHRYSVSAKTFWESVYFDDKYTTALHMDGLGCQSFELLHQDGCPELGIERSMRSVPNIQIPRALQRVLGSQIAYTERGAFDADSHHYTFQLVPSVMAHKISISGTTKAREPDPNFVEVETELTFSVRILGLGKLLEQFIAQSNLSNQERVGRFTLQWIADHPQRPSP